MINMTHTVGGFSLSLLLINFGVAVDSSIWAILFSVYLGQLPDIDLKGSSISKKKGIRSVGFFIRQMVKGHREQTHSIFFCLFVTLLLLPLAIFLHKVDGSSILDNSLIFFFGIFSHLLLDFFNKQQIPLFYIPLINNIEKARKYNIDSFSLPYIRSIKVNSEKEFSRITIPLLLLSFFLIISNKDIFYYKILEGSELIINNIWLTIFLLFLGLYNNYLFRNGGFKDFVYSLYGAFKKGGSEDYIKWNYLKSILRESNFSQVLINLLILFSIGFNSSAFINNIGDFIYSIGSTFSLLYVDGLSISSIIAFLNEIVKNIFY